MTVGGRPTAVQAADWTPTARFFFLAYILGFFGLFWIEFEEPKILILSSVFIQVSKEFWALKFTFDLVFFIGFGKSKKSVFGESILVHLLHHYF